MSPDLVDQTKGIAGERAVASGWPKPAFGRQVIAKKQITLTSRWLIPQPNKDSREAAVRFAWECGGITAT
jgi:hypothetical protein